MLNISKDICLNITIYAIIVIILITVLRQILFTENFSTQKRSIKKLKTYNPTNLTVYDKIYFRNNNHSDDNDVYTLNKIKESDNNSLRLTLNDDPNEKLEIWGNSCNTAQGCDGPGEKAHTFTADGKSYHNQICLKKSNNDYFCMNGDTLDQLKIKRLYQQSRHDCGYPWATRGFYRDGWGFCRWVGDYVGQNFACEKDDGTYVNNAEKIISPDDKHIPYSQGTYSYWNC